jgi:Tfp pilus assembly protein PilF
LKPYKKSPNRTTAIRKNKGIKGQGEIIMKLSTTKMTFVAVITLVVIAVAGCETKAAHQRNAEQRWQKTLEQAKLNYAQQYLDQGQYAQAKAILEPMASGGKDPQAEMLLTEVEQRRSLYANALEASGY